MKAGKNRLTIVAIWILLALSMFSCVIGGLENQLKGKWIETSGTGMELEFYDQGTVVVSILGVSTTGSYEVLDSDTIRVEFTGLVGSLIGSQVYDVAIEDDRMILYSNNATLDFIRY